MPLAILRALVLLLLAAVPAAAQNVECTRFRPRVEKLSIVGNKSIRDFDLQQILYTERAGRLRRWFGWNVGATACLDSLELLRDERRLASWYAMRGYPGTAATASVDRTSSRTAIVKFVVREATPVVIDTLRLVGIPTGVLDRARLVRNLRGAPLDDSVLVAVLDSVQQILRADGYARARPPKREVQVDSAARRARVTMTFTPGNPIRVGAIEVAMTSNGGGSPALDEKDIRELLRFKKGDVYSSRAVASSQQLLYSYDLYRTVAIDTLSAQSSGDTLPVRVRLIEGRHNSLRMGAGWGTIDCFRTRSRFVEQNLLGRGHRLQMDLRLSKIGVGAPLNGFPDLCAPRVRADTFSLKLNYYVGATVSLRGVIGDRWHPVGTLYSERRTEFQSYVRETTIGAVGSFDRPIVPRVNTTFTYRFDAGRTTSDAAVSCGTFGLCRFNDRFLLNSPSVLHSAGTTFSRSAPSLTSFATNDERWAIESRIGTVRVGRPGTRINFNRTQMEYALYRPLSRTIIGAARFSAGFIATKRDLESLVPPQERFYSGGQNSVRGYNQGELGPTVYIVRSPTDTISVGGQSVGFADPTRGFDRTSPAGGTASALLNLELRSRVGWPSDLLRWVIFLDAGRVWNNSGNYAVTGLRATPGVGVRLVTPLGPFRVDIGYNPHQREAGPAFYLQRATSTLAGRAICVSPGSVEPLNDAAADALGPVACPSSFRPPVARGLFPRLTFHFSIGEAF